MKIVKNTFLLYSTRIVDVLATFIQIKLLALYLPKVVVGEIFFTIGVSSFVSTLFFAGFPLVFVRYVPKMEKDESALLLNFSVVLYFMGLLISVIVGGLFYKNLPFWILFTGVYLSGILTLIGSYLIGKREVKFYFGLTLLKSLVLILLLYFLRHLLSFLTLGYVLGLAGLAILISFYSIEGIFHFNLREAKFLLKKIGNFWRYSFLDQLFQPVFMYLYRIITPYVVGFDALASFTVSRRIDNFSRRIFQVPLDVISPEISYRDEQKERIIPALVELKKIYVTLSGIFFILYVIAGRFVIKLIATGAYLDAFYPLLILALGLLISSTYSIDATYLRSIGRMRPYFIHNVVWMVTFIVSFVILSKYYGLIGMAISYPVGHILAGIYVKLKIEERELLKPDLLFLPLVILVLLALIFLNEVTVLVVGIYILILSVSINFGKMRLQR